MFQRLVDIVFWLAMTLWVGVIVAAGIAAASVFSILPDLNLTIARYQGFDPEQHGVLAGGHVMEPIFTAVDIAQVAFAAIVLVAVVIQSFRKRRSRWMRVIRLALVAIALVNVGYRVGIQAPQMNADLRAYWAAAEAGDADSARHHRAAFDLAHPAASRLYQATLFTLLILCTLSAVEFGPPSASPPRSPRREPPVLLKRT